jgi:hypothetical protein
LVVVELVEQEVLRLLYHLVHLQVVAEVVEQLMLVVVLQLVEQPDQAVVEQEETILELILDVMQQLTLVVVAVEQQEMYHPLQVVLVDLVDQEELS